MAGQGLRLNRDLGLPGCRTLDEKLVLSKLLLKGGEYQILLTKLSWRYNMAPKSRHCGYQKSRNEHCCCCCC